MCTCFSTFFTGHNVLRLRQKPKSPASDFSLNDVCKPGHTLLWDLVQDNMAVRLSIQKVFYPCNFLFFFKVFDRRKMEFNVLKQKRFMLFLLLQSQICLQFLIIFLLSSFFFYLTESFARRDR